jgi:hypothetical protein
MAITLKISNGDFVINDSSGRFKTIGNRVGQDDPDQATQKNSQDLKRSLSLGRVPNGSTANIVRLVGTVPESGSQSVALLINRQIRNMFASILRLQRLRPNVRPNREKFSSISTLRVFKETGERTRFRFRLGVKTTNKEIVTITGALG